MPAWLGEELVPEVHGRDPRATRRALNRLTRRRAWSPETAISYLRRLEKFGLDYIEQPTPPGDWDAFCRVGESTSIPLMLDEGLRSDEDVEQLARLGAPTWPT